MGCLNVNETEQDQLVRFRSKNVVTANTKLSSAYYELNGTSDNDEALIYAQTLQAVRKNKELPKPTNLP